MASKRDRDSSGTSSGPPAKKPMTQFEPVKIGPIYSLVSMVYWNLLCIIVGIDTHKMYVNPWRNCFNVIIVIIYVYDLGLHVISLLRL